MYNITKGTLSNPNNRLGIYEDDDEEPEQSDLDQFYAEFAPEIPASIGPKIELIDYGTSRPNASNAVGEAAIDFDMSQPLLYPQSTTLFMTHDNFYVINSTEDGIFNQFLDAVDGAYCYSTSHGETGDDPTVDGVTPNEECGVFIPTNVISFSYGWPEADYPVGYVEVCTRHPIRLRLLCTSDRVDSMI
jgi:tripeptidyl-peptidase-1